MQGSARSAVWDALVRHRRLFLALLLFLVAVGGYYVGIKGTERSAINRWGPQVSALWQGKDIYYEYGFPTPPIMAILLTPFATLPGAGAMASWFAFKSILFLAVVALCLSWAEERRGLSAAALLIPLALGLRPAMGDLLHGNVNLWILFLVVASVAAFRAGRDGWGGMLLSLAIACKLTPALMIPYFAWKRAWWMVASTLVGLVLWWLVVPGMFLGFERNRELLHHWSDMMVRPYVAEGKVDTEQVNQSAVALLHRALTNGIAIEEEGTHPETRIGWASWDAVTLGHVWLGVVSVTLIGLAWLCRHHWPDRRSAGWLLEIGLVWITMLMISERSWKHHFVWLLPIGIILVSALEEARARGRSRRSIQFLWSLLVGALLFQLSTSQDLVRPLAGEYGAKLMQAWGAYVWGSLLLAGALATLLSWQPRPVGTGSRILFICSGLFRREGRAIPS